VLVAAFLMTCIARPLAAGSDFTVETTLDGADAAPGDGICAGISSLRKASETAPPPRRERLHLPAARARSRS